jgi:CheY-like chemotaxis protein
MKQINILIVEDKSTIIERWKRALTQFNRKAEKDSGPFNFYAEYAESHEAAKGKLRTFSFDIAVIDIRLANSKTDGLGHLDTSGNEVLKDILNNAICLAAIYTGQSGDADISAEQSNFIKVIDRSAMTERELLESFVKEEELINSIISIKDNFSKSKATFFYSSIWPRWKFWLTGNQKKEITETALIRHMATHLHASFLNETNEVHPEEYFFVPALNSKLDTGDILKVEDDYYILVTARCDLARGENETFHLVKLSCIQEKWTKLIENDSSTSRGKISNIVSHNKSPKCHFIPQIQLTDTEALGPFLASFNFMQCHENTSVKSAELLDSRIATLTNEFVPSLVERLGSYFARIGDPDYGHQSS